MFTFKFITKLLVQNYRLTQKLKSKQKKEKTFVNTLQEILKQIFLNINSNYQLVNNLCTYQSF